MFILEQKEQIPGKDMNIHFQQSPLKNEIVKENIGLLQSNKTSKDYVMTKDTGVSGLNWQLPKSYVLSLESDASSVGLKKLSIPRTSEPVDELNFPREKKSTVHRKKVFPYYHKIPGGIGEIYIIVIIQ